MNVLAASIGILCRGACMPDVRSSRHVQLSTLYAGTGDKSRAQHTCVLPLTHVLVVVVVVVVM